MESQIRSIRLLLLLSSVSYISGMLLMPKSGVCDDVTLDSDKSCKNFILNAYQSGHFHLNSSEERRFADKEQVLKSTVKEVYTDFLLFLNSTSSLVESNPEVETLKTELCRFAKNHYNKTLVALERIAYMMGPKNDMMDLIFKKVIQKSKELCATNVSPKVIFYDIYNFTMGMEYRGQIMLSLFDHWLAKFHAEGIPECDYEVTNKIVNDKFALDYTDQNNRLTVYRISFSRMMAKQQYIPEFNACDKFHDPDKDLDSFKSFDSLNEKIREEVIQSASKGSQLQYLMTL